jgi:hypothetical protein
MGLCRALSMHLPHPGRILDAHAGTHSAPVCTNACTYPPPPPTHTHTHTAVPQFFEFVALPLFNNMRKIVPGLKPMWLSVSAVGRGGGGGMGRGPSTVPEPTTKVGPGPLQHGMPPRCAAHAP